MNRSQTSICHRLSSRLSKCPRWRNRYSMSLCQRWSNSWWKCRRPFPKTDSSSGTVEEIVDAPVPQAEEELAEAFKVFSKDWIQQRIVEQTIPAIPLAEKIVELPVIQTEEKMQQVANTFVQQDVSNAVEVEKPKIIELTVQRKKFIIQEKINQETKPVELPQAQSWTRLETCPLMCNDRYPWPRQWKL